MRFAPERVLAEVMLPVKTVVPLKVLVPLNVLAPSTTSTPLLVRLVCAWRLIPEAVPIISSSVSGFLVPIPMFPESNITNSWFSSPSGSNPRKLFAVL